MKTGIIKLIIVALILTLIPLATEVNAQIWEPTYGPYDGPYLWDMWVLAINAGGDIFVGTGGGGGVPFE